MQAWDLESPCAKLKIQSCVKPRQNQTKPKPQIPERANTMRFTRLTYKVTLQTGSVFKKTFNGTCNYNHKDTSTT